MAYRPKIDGLIRPFNRSALVSQWPEYRIWQGMKMRCKLYPRYAQLGMCEEWITSFVPFYEHIGPRPSRAHSVDRIDNSKGYFPGNVRWATQKEQARNRSTNRALEINGEKVLICEAVERFRVPLARLQGRVWSGWAGNDLIKRKQLGGRPRSRTVQQSS